jgi:hypothetical protein
MENVTMNFNKSIKDTNNISLREDEKTHALFYYVCRKHKEGCSL